MSPRIGPAVSSGGGGGGGGGGGVVGSVKLATSAEVAGASGAVIQWGQGANPLDATPIYLTAAGAVTTQPEWITDPAGSSPTLALGTYIVDLRVTSDIVPDGDTQLRLTMQVAGEPILHDIVLPATATDDSSFVWALTGFVVAAQIGRGPYGLFQLLVEPANDGGTLGTANYSAEVLIGKLS